VNDPIVSLSADSRRQLADLAKQLKAVDAEARKALPKRLREAAKPVADEANRLKPSKQIKIGTRVKLAGRNGASVKVIGTSPKNPALAGLLEAGNSGSRDTTSFRHPVFGDKDVWVNQPTKPYLFPAGQNKKSQAQQAIAKVIDDIAATIKSQGVA
jgi:hypothetical protein